MEWLFVVAAGLVIFIFAFIKDARKKKRNAAYSAEIDVFKQSLLTDDNTASLAVLNATEHRYRPVTSENLLAIQDRAARMEMKSTGRYKTGRISVSIPIVKGVRYRIGSGSVHAKKSWNVTARGRLLVTDKAIVFEGGDKNERINWTQVANVELMSDGFIITKRSGPQRTYQVASPDPKFAAMIELMLARL
jgi:hypothetical protein